MNRTRLVVAAGITVLLALIASMGVYKFLLDKNRQAERARLQTVGVVVATVDIPLGTTINPNQVATVAWPKDQQPKDAHSDPKKTVGRVAKRDFLRGEPIVESKLVASEKIGGILSLKVPPGMRAFSVKVNEVVGVGGFIVPDARVDVVVTTSPNPQRQQEQISKTVLEDVLVLAAGQVIEQKENKPVTVNTVTLAVTPEEAEKLALASNDGKIQLVLRHYADSEKVQTAGVDKARLLSSYRNAPPAQAAPVKAKAGKTVRVAKAEAPAAPAKKRSVEVIKGTKRSEEEFH